MYSSYMIGTLTVLLLITSLFMILLVLIQRGRGGGLAGAFGGMGGQSAFGTRAGDVFTKITVVVAIIFILLSALLGVSMRGNQRKIDSGEDGIFTPNPAAVVEAAETAGEEAAPTFDATDDTTDAAAEESDDTMPAEESSEATAPEDSASTEVPAEGASTGTPEPTAENSPSKETTEPSEEPAEPTSSE
jgi:preprotein translocase subunit SecG